MKPNNSTQDVWGAMRLVLAHVRNRHFWVVFQNWTLPSLRQDVARVGALEQKVSRKFDLSLQAEANREYRKLRAKRRGPLLPNGPARARADLFYQMRPLSLLL